MGEYFTPKPKQKPHECEPPMAFSVGGRPLEPEGFAGQGWRCECGKAWIVVGMNHRNETWKQWERLPEEDKA